MEPEMAHCTKITLGSLETASGPREPLRTTPERLPKLHAGPVSRLFDAHLAAFKKHLGEEKLRSTDALAVLALFQAFVDTTVANCPDTTLWARGPTERTRGAGERERP